MLLITFPAFAANYMFLHNFTSLQRYIGFGNSNYSQLIGRINGTIHGNLISLLAASYLFGMIDTETWLSCLDITRGYCLYDTLMILYFTPGDIGMLAHHTMLFLGTYSNFISVYPSQVALGLLSELSNQNLHLGWLMIKLQKYDCLLFKINAIMLLVLFLFFRVINFTYLFIFSYNNCSYLEPIVISPILLLNYYWFYLLSGKVINTIN